MITPFEAILLVGFGVFVSLVCVSWGAIVHMRYLDRKLLPPAQKPPAKPGNGATI